MKENETSVTFHIEKELLKKFDEASKDKAKDFGIPLNRKQSLQLAIKDAIEKWTTKNPGQ